MKTTSKAVSGPVRARARRGAAESTAIAKVEAPPLPAPSVGESKAIAFASDKFAGRRQPVKSGILPLAANGVMRMTSPHSDAKGWEKSLRSAFGTRSKEFVDTNMVALTNVLQDAKGNVNICDVDAVLAVLDGADPKDEIEAMLVLQMAITHVLAMRSARSLAKSREIPQQDSNGLALHRLTKTFTTLIDALAKIRRGGEQRVIVEHVHVYPGGQAIVGNVTTTGGGAGFGNLEQPHAADNARAIALAGSSEVWRENAPGQPMPIPDSSRQEAMPDARGRAGVGSTIGEKKRQLPARTFHSRRNGGTGVGAKVVA